MTRSQNIIWLGGTGVGKTGLALSFLVHTINQGYRARYVMFAELVAELYQSVAESLTNRINLKEFDRLPLGEVRVWSPGMKGWIWIGAGAVFVVLVVGCKATRAGYESPSLHAD